MNMMNKIIAIAWDFIEANVDELNDDGSDDVILHLSEHEEVSLAQQRVNSQNNQQSQQLLSSCIPQTDADARTTQLSSQGVPTGTHSDEDSVAENEQGRAVPIHDGGAENGTNKTLDHHHRDPPAVGCDGNDGNGGNDGNEDDTNTTTPTTIATTVDNDKSLDHHHHHCDPPAVGCDGSEGDNTADNTRTQVTDPSIDHGNNTRTRVTYPSIDGNNTRTQVTDPSIDHGNNTSTRDTDPSIDNGNSTSTRDTDSSIDDGNSTSTRDTDPSIDDANNRAQAFVTFMALLTSLRSGSENGSARNDDGGADDVLLDHTEFIARANEVDGDSVDSAVEGDGSNNEPGDIGGFFIGRPVPGTAVAVDSDSDSDSDDDDGDEAGDSGIDTDTDEEAGDSGIDTDTND
ncbi:hypothetical protein PTSG_04483 [Salpingoeca rosetta]|uniref:Uncharacterized protein n=1 Tax=Salpingoeca rosetta (strain ATCC 50818 / BSB-021) TaxID=946362 RepID=F2U8P5_SALR5|nr:uncharacterized protein PTSG_04483 [Salpingoeca rosetta]EGD72753.1 hypothetical protein PTSG_04483 [Salpingoeca rosetta]|eukprot:XP_004994576.1 hypothetical protein PTSG_04483 [Salpingoeca rosetta]